MALTLFGEIAVQKQHITREILENALAEQEKLRNAGVTMFLGQVLVKNGDLSMKQVSQLLDIQKELLLRGVSPDILGTGKGIKAINDAHTQVTIRRFLPWAVVGVLVILLLVGLPRFFGHQDRESGQQAPGRQTSASGKIDAGTEAAISQLVAAIFDVNLLLKERMTKINELNQYPVAAVFPIMEKTWRTSEPADGKQVAMVSQYLYGRDAQRTKEVLLGLLQENASLRLGYASLYALMNKVNDDPTFWSFLTAGVESEDPFIKEKALESLPASKQPFTQELQDKLKKVLAAHEPAPLSGLAMAALCGRDGFADYAFLVEQLKAADEQTANEIVTSVLRNKRTEVFGQMFETALVSPQLLDLMITSLRLYPSPQGEEFLLKVLKTGDGGTKVKVIRTLAVYQSTAVLRALREQLDSTDRLVQSDTVRSLQMITRQDFGYRFSGTPEENAGAVKKWKEYLAKK